MRVDLFLPGEVAAIETAVERVKRVLQRGGFPFESEFEVDLALREALSNAIVHGCREDPSKTVHLQARYFPGEGLTLTVRDEGSGFDPSSVPPPVTRNRICLPHGRGLFLLGKLMDRVRFSQGARSVQLFKRLGRAQRQT